MPPKNKQNVPQSNLSLFTFQIQHIHPQIQFNFFNENALIQNYTSPTQISLLIDDDILNQLISSNFYLQLIQDSIISQEYQFNYGILLITQSFSYVDDLVQFYLTLDKPIPIERSLLYIQVKNVQNLPFTDEKVYFQYKIQDQMVRSNPQQHSNCIKFNVSHLFTDFDLEKQLIIEVHDKDELIKEQYMKTQSLMDLQEKEEIENKEEKKDDKKKENKKKENKKKEVEYFIKKNKIEKKNNFGYAKFNLKQLMKVKEDKMSSIILPKKQLQKNLEESLNLDLNNKAKLITKNRQNVQSSYLENGASMTILVRIINEYRIQKIEIQFMRVFYKIAYKEKDIVIQLQNGFKNYNDLEFQIGAMELIDKNFRIYLFEGKIETIEKFIIENLNIEPKKVEKCKERFYQGKEINRVKLKKTLQNLLLTPKLYIENNRNIIDILSNLNEMKIVKLDELNLINIEFGCNLNEEDINGFVKEKQKNGDKQVYPQNQLSKSLVLPRIEHITYKVKKFNQDRYTLQMKQKLENSDGQSIYSGQKNNSYKIQLEELQKKIEKDKDHYYTYSLNYLSQSIPILPKIKKEQLKPFKFSGKIEKKQKVYKKIKICKEIQQEEEKRQQETQKEDVSIEYQDDGNHFLTDFKLYLKGIDYFSIPTPSKLRREHKEEKQDKFIFKVKMDNIEQSSIDKYKSMLQDQPTKKGFSSNQTPISILSKEPYSNQVDCFTRKINLAKQVSKYGFE